MLTTTYDLNLSPGGVPLIIPVSQYDAASRILCFNLVSPEGSISLPSGTQAEIRGTKPDGNGFSYAATLSGTLVTAVVTEQMTAAAGRARCELVLYKGTPATTQSPASQDYQQIATANFILHIERAALDKDTLSSNSEIRQLVNVIDRTDEIIAAAAQSDAAKERIIALEAATRAAREAAQQSEAAAAQSAREAASSAAAAVATLESLSDAVEAERDAALAALEVDYTAKRAAIEAIRTNAEAIAHSAVETATGADTIAKQALEKATNAENEAMETTAHLEETSERMETLQAGLDGKIDGGYVEDGYLILTINGEPSGERLGPFAGEGGGGGGGGNGNNAVLSVSNTSGWMSKTIAQGGSCPVSFLWTSMEEELPTGNGSLRVVVNGSQKAILDIPQGNITVDVAPYLSVGANTVALTVSDVYQNRRTIRPTVTVVALSLSSSFDARTPYTGSIIFPYTPVGSVRKTVHFVFDGVEISTAETSVSGRQQSFMIPAQSHGVHTFSAYFEAVINGETVRSNELFYEIICLEVGNATPIISSDFRVTEIKQYGTANIPYAVYDPNSLSSTVRISVDGEAAATLTVDRTPQVFSYRAMVIGEHTITLQCGSVTRSFSFTVVESGIEVEAETEDLVLYLSSYGRSNNSDDRSEWNSGSIEASLTGFNFTSDGWQRDKQGNTVLRVAGDARVTIPYKLFGSDFRSTGKTIELEFSTSAVMDYDAVILSCMSAGRGLRLTAQSVTLASEQSVISTQFKEDEHVRVSFVIEKRTENRLIYCYINGIISGVVQYAVNDDFSQVPPVDITIGSNDCAMDIYCIRVYDNDLTRHQMLTNWIADTQDMDEMLDRFTRNAVYDAYGAIAIENLPADLPYLVIEAVELPQYKGDKKTVSGRYVDPANPSRNFTFTGAQWDVQGTSSQYYERKNYKGKFKNGFVLANGTTISKYELTDGTIPINVLCFKADVASSEGANNVELVRLYCYACPYLTPAQVADPRVRQGIDGYPIVVFWDDGNTTTFIGKYNTNADKSAEEFFGFQEDDESWEVKNNTSARVLGKSADFEGDDWLNDFEARFPDTDPPYEDPTQLREFAEWLVSTDTTAATEEPLLEPVTYGTGDDAVTFTIDSADYRLAKFKAELGDYVELQSCLFYYLFTELFLMVDSRAKNMFPSFIGAPVSPVEPDPSEEPEGPEPSEEPGSGDEPGSDDEPGSGDEPGSDDPGNDDPGNDDPSNTPTGE